MGNDNASSRINLHASQIFLQERWSKISRPSARKNIKDRPIYFTRFSIYSVAHVSRIGKKERERERKGFIYRPRLEFDDRLLSSPVYLSWECCHWKGKSREQQLRSRPRLLFREMKSNREKGRKRERRVVSPVSFLLENNRREEEILEIRNSKHGIDNG